MPFTSKQSLVLFHSEQRKELSCAWALALALVLCLFPVPGFAADTTLGSIICGVKDNLAAYPYIVNVTAYIMGAFMAVRAFLLLKKHGDNPAQSQVVPAVAHLFVAGCLLAFPFLAGVIQHSIFGVGGGAGAFGCVPGAVTSSSGSVGLDQMMQNLVKNIYGPMNKLLSLIAVAAGLTFIVGALLRGAKTGTDPRAADPKGIIAHLVFGAILISVGTVLPSVLMSLFGSSDVSKMTDISLIQWSKLTGSSGNTEAANNAVRAVLAFIQIIGGISFVRGWLILKKAVEGGQATVPQGLTHIIGGAMAINIDVMIKAIDKTFGTQITSA